MTRGFEWEEQRVDDVPHDMVDGFCVDGCRGTRGPLGHARRWPEPETTESHIVEPTCCLCSALILRGTIAVYEGDGKWSHPECEEVPLVVKNADVEAIKKLRGEHLGELFITLQLTPEERLEAWNAYPHGPEATQPWLCDGEVPGVGVVIGCRCCRRPVVKQADGGPGNCYWCGQPSPFSVG